MSRLSEHRLVRDCSEGGGWESPQHQERGLHVNVNSSGERGEATRGAEKGQMGCVECEGVSAKFWLKSVHRLDRKQRPTLIHSPPLCRLCCEPVRSRARPLVNAEEKWAEPRR